MHFCRWMTAIVVGFCWSNLESSAAAALVLSSSAAHPASLQLNADVHILPGAKFSGTSVTAPPENSFVAGHAYRYLAGGLLRVDGGEFRGGNVTYNGPKDSFASVYAGSGLVVSSSKVEIHDGLFQGGRAFSTSASGAASPGAGLSVSVGEASIFGGRFEGGDRSTPNAPYWPSNFPSSGADIHAAGSTLHVYGGRFDYVVLGVNTKLHLYGTNLQLHSFNHVTGFLADGRYANVLIYTDTRESIVLHNIPEASTLNFAAVAAVVGIIPITSRQRGWHRHSADCARPSR
jgi:hypothetical protein